MHGPLHLWQFPRIVTAEVVLAVRRHHLIFSPDLLSLHDGEIGNLHIQ